VEEFGEKGLECAPIYVLYGQALFLDAKENNENVLHHLLNQKEELVLRM
jgi:hypothetical protein